MTDGYVIVSSGGVAGVAVIVHNAEV